MAEYGEEDLAFAAAKILLSLRSRKLVRWPEWIARPSDGLQRPGEEEEETELPPIPEGWPKRPRLRLRARAKGTAWLQSSKCSFERLDRPVHGGSGARSGEEERAWSAPKEKRLSLTAPGPEVPPHYGSCSAAGSGPSTSGADPARSRRRPHVSEKVTADSAESSPKTPLDFANATGSGAASSGDEAAAQGSAGCGGPSSSIEGRSSPAKRSRTDLAAGEAAAAAAKVEVSLPAAAAAKVEEQKIKDNGRDENGHLLFDLNEACVW